MARGKRPGIVFYVGAIIFLLVAYPLSFGPLVYLFSRGLVPGWAAWPLTCYALPFDTLVTYVANQADPHPLKPVISAIISYVELWRS